ncbi:LIM domain-containing protein [Methylobacterium sp.]|uniref:LIM domain-containing protein n=1 Tax=Methylobacterium sp. TaxID=409 RepID=UPI003C78BC4E
MPVKQMKCIRIHNLCFDVLLFLVGLGGTKFISFEERHWHSDCFVCYKCNVSLVGRGFLTDAEDILCPDCGRV